MTRAESIRQRSVSNVILGAMFMFVHAAPTFGQSLDAPKDWRGEVIKLPPSFAKDMKLSGHEEIRFAPGMFQSQNESFFSYILAFNLDPEPQLLPEVLQRELLTYYRGLSRVVLGTRGKEVDTSTFSLKLASKPQSAEPGQSLLQDRVIRTVQYTGTMKWIEPFQTGKEQTLLMDIDTWTAKNDDNQDRSMILMCVSPASRDAEIWKQLHEIRSRFLK